MAKKTETPLFEDQKRLKEGQYLKFDFFPIPPSVNKIYKHFLDPRSKKIKRVSTNDLKRFKKSCEQWAMANLRLCQVANEYLRDEECIKVVTYVVLHADYVYTKDGKLRQMDVTNRGKALYDCLSEILGIDDRHFTDCRIVKTLTTDGPQKCVVYFCRSDIPTIDDITTMDHNG